MHLSRFPRLHFAHLPTPLEPMPRISEYLGGPNLWIKRDDCTGLSSGGNKTRKLEFLMADAIERGADIIITQGATQSNHARQTCAASARLGLECHILLEDRTGYQDEAYAYNGNVLLDQLHGASISLRPADSDMNAEMEQRTLDFMGLSQDLVPRDSVVANSDYVGDGYGIPTNSMVEAVKMLAEFEGILLDPVYSGKGFAGLIDLVRQGHFKKGENVVFLHTGGSVSLFAYPKVFNLPGYL